MTRFQDMLIYLRKREGLSQLELANKLGAAKSTISMYENGTRKPSFEMLETIADFFNVNMSLLLGEEETKKPIPENELDDEIMKLFSELRPDEVDKVATFAQGIIAGRKD